MRVYDIIEKKRDGGALTTEEIQFFIEGYTRGTIPDYQAAALLMAIYLRGMDDRETVDLTEAMMHSGDVIDLSAIEGTIVDKHSTGGVGDTTTLVLAPLVASLGVPVAKMSGRGLGHTGGTIDKLESIPGFHTELSIEDFIDQVNREKVAVIGQTADIAPADKKLYALRDVTATVSNISLIASSIMSKKLAAGADAIVLDVKVGSGAFLKTFDEAKELAETMVRIGTNMGRETIAVITNMDEPLGRAIGNSLEVIEAVDTLKGHGPADLEELCLTLGANMVYLAGKAEDFDAAHALLAEKIKSGEALATFGRFVKSQGGDDSVTSDLSVLPKAEHEATFTADRDGYIGAIASDEVGISAMILGAGRQNKEDAIDMAAGILLEKKIGDAVKAGDVIARLYTSRPETLDEAKKRLAAAVTIGSEQASHKPLIQAILTKEGIRTF